MHRTQRTASNGGTYTTTRLFHGERGWASQEVWADYRAMAVRASAVLVAITIRQTRARRPSKAPTSLASGRRLDTAAVVEQRRGGIGIGITASWIDVFHLPACLRRRPLPPKRRIWSRRNACTVHDGRMTHRRGPAGCTGWAATYRIAAGHWRPLNLLRPLAVMALRPRTTRTGELSSRRCDDGCRCGTSGTVDTGPSRSGRTGSVLEVS